MGEEVQECEQRCDSLMFILSVNYDEFFITNMKTGWAEKNARGCMPISNVIPEGVG